jgi:hypothetical protein
MYYWKEKHMLQRESLGAFLWRPFLKAMAHVLVGGISVSQ